MTNLSPYENIRSMCIDTIKTNMQVDGRKNLIQGEIEEYVSGVLNLNPTYRKIFDEESLVNDLKMSFNIKTVHKQIILSNNEDKVQWYTNERKKNDRSVGFWKRYETFSRKKIPGLFAQQLDDCTDQVMENIEDPKKMGKWDIRGLVMGSVQSGKTSQIVGVVNKALDAGYNFIVVLTGMTNDLRSQTQSRIDEGVLGIETYNEHGHAEQLIGVGNIDTVQFQPESFTNSSSSGDFSKKIYRHVQLDPDGRAPRILVMKKTKSVLKLLIKKFGDLTENFDQDKISHFPIMVIDDECDQASVDTKKDEEQLSAINETIRELLNIFERKVYIGYTATPYANAAINHLAMHRDFEIDLYPKDFIFQLPINSDYVGLNRLFPEIIIDDDGNEIDSKVNFHSALRTITDYVDDYKRFKDREYERNIDITGWMPPAHKSNNVPKFKGKKVIPPSLEEAIIYFSLSCCVKRIRNKESLKHNSMMIHATRFNDVQSEIVVQVDDFLQKLKSTQYGWIDEIESKIKKVWDDLFVGKLNNSYNPKDKDIIWADIRGVYGDQISLIRVQEINNKTRDILDYRGYKKDGKHVIAIGGNRLSRGLTLEGLNVSYYLRSARTSAVATATQMGRWFGYRNSYDDVCKIYMPESTIYLFQKLYETERHFRAEIELMNKLGKTPLDFGLNFLSFDGIKLDSPAKMRHVVKYSQNIDQSGKIKQVTSVIPNKNSDNLSKTENFLNSLGYPNFVGPGIGNEATKKYNPNKSKNQYTDLGSYIWKNIDGKKVSEFIKLKNFIIPTHELYNNDGDLVSEYIDLMMNYDELKEWTVVLRSKIKGNLKSIISGYHVNIAKRKARNKNYNREESLKGWQGDVDDFYKSYEEKFYKIGATNDPGVESYDLDKTQLKEKDEFEEKFKIYDEDDNEFVKNYKKGQIARHIRKPNNGLLILYPFYPNDEVNKIIDKPYIAWSVSFPFRESRPGNKLNREISLNTVKQEEIRKREEEALKKIDKNEVDVSDIGGHIPEDKNDFSEFVDV